jgi:hypothetical protein
MTDRKSYQKQYYRKQAMDSMRSTIKNLKALRKQFLESPEGIAYKKRLTDDYAKKYREKNFEKMKSYLKDYRTL